MYNDLSVLLRISFRYKVSAVYITSPSPWQSPKEPCQDVSGNITQYQIKGITRNVNIARCTAGRCSHTFEPPSNTPSRYYGVSVAAVNVVGVGAARTCTTQTIRKLNFIILIKQKFYNLYMHVMGGAHIMHLAALLSKVINYSNPCCTSVSY